MAGEYPEFHLRRLAESHAHELGSDTVDPVHLICAAFQYDRNPMCLTLFIFATWTEVVDAVIRVVGRGEANVVPQWSAEASQMLLALRKNRQRATPESDARVLLREVLRSTNEVSLASLASLGVDWKSVALDLAWPELPPGPPPPETQPIPADLAFARPHNANERVRRLIRSIVRNRARNERDPDPAWVEFEELMVLALRERCALLDAEREG